MKMPPLTSLGKVVSRADQRFDFYDLFENEFGTSPHVKEEITRVLNQENLARYPSDDNQEIRATLGEFLGLSAESFILGNGSGELLEKILAAHTEKGDEVISTIPTWDGFNAFCRMQGLIHHHVPFYVDGEEITVDFSYLQKQITPRTKLIYLVSPSLPGGIGINTDQFLKFMEHLPASITVVVDEAYLGFSDRTDLLETHKHIATLRNPVYGLRTFSKFLGLANLRIGFALARPDVMERLLLSEPPFVLSTLSERAAIATVTDKHFQGSVRNQVKSEKSWIKDRVREMKLNVRKTDFNYLLVDVAQYPDPLAFFDDRGIFLPRNLFMDKYLQFPVSTRPKNEKNLSVLSELVATRSP